MSAAPAAFVRDWIAGQLAGVRPSWLPRTPTVLQMENVECGAACLAMILAWHGRWARLEELRVACGVTRDGSNASNILRAAHGYGLAARGFRKEPEQLDDLPMPCIVHWNFNHFVVLEGLDRHGAWLNDPGQGRRRVSLETFGQSFTGVVLAFEPTAAFAKAGRPPAVLPIALRLLAGSRPAMWLLLAVSASLVIPGLLLPAFARLFVDDVLVRRSDDWLFPLLVGLALTAAGRGLVTAFQQSLLLRLETKLSVLLTARFLWRVLALPIGFFQQRHAGDIAARVDANESLTRVISGTLATNALNLISVAFFALALAAYDAGLAAICIGFALLNVAAVAAVGRRRDELNLSLGVERGKVAAATVGIVRTIETLKAGGLEDDAFAGWTGRHALLLEGERRLGLYALVDDVAPPLFAGLTTAAILGLGGMKVMRGEMTLGSLVAFQGLMASLAAPISGLAQSAGPLLAAKSWLLRLEDVYAFPTPPPAETPARSDGLSGQVSLADVGFRYGPLDPAVVEGVSFVAEPGARIALVGSSGSGKSTVGRLLCGLYAPDQGTVRFDGVARAALSDDLFAASAAYVDQDVFLFEGTLRENLSLWDPAVGEAEMIEALKDAAIHDEVLARPGGLDCDVREGGANFSGGQRQRIEIARALVGQPSVLILDEATSALDPAAEKAVYDNLRRRGCTCIVIAHRLSAIRDSDEIIVLERGRVRERGAHPTLAAAGGAYVRMVASG